MVMDALGGGLPCGALPLEDIEVCRDRAGAAGGIGDGGGGLSGGWSDAAWGLFDAEGMMEGVGSARNGSASCLDAPCPTSGFRRTGGADVPLGCPSSPSDSVGRDQTHVSSVRKEGACCRHPVSCVLEFLGHTELNGCSDIGMQSYWGHYPVLRAFRTCLQLHELRVHACSIASGSGPYEGSW
eukprot:447481-Pelagomonas_calceolata.AAC.1